ncbi:MAG: DUF547 domain-containing protein [Planctomycetes bacterium]|nr:DUF547 domain-containing protein [Planctomycetota bacterium]
MAKRLAVFTISLVVLVFFAGCPQPKTALAEPNESEPNQSQSNETETDKDESYPADANQTPHIGPPPQQVEPNDIEPGRTEPNEITPPVPEPNQAGPNEVAPAKAEPNDIDVKPTTTEPNDVKPGPATAFHDKCANILKTYVDKKGMVNYKKLRYKKLELKSLLNEFDNLDPNEYKSWAREDRIALWINAYNIQMLNIITRNYPIKPSSRILLIFPGWGPNSIRHIEGIWTKDKFFVTDEVFTLEQIEERFFRKEFQDPRIFFVLTRATVSGPPLRNEPYYGHKLNKQLDDQVKKFLAGPLAFKIDKQKGKVYLSALFQKPEYGKEFLSKYGTDKKFKGKEPETSAVLNFITNYVSEDTKTFLELGNYTVQFMAYNWTINDGS